MSPRLLGVEEAAAAGEAALGGLRMAHEALLALDKDDVHAFSPLLRCGA